MANAFILTWNPAHWSWDEREYAKEVKATSAGKLFSSQWSCGNTKRICPDDRLFLLRQGTKRGLIGSGFATSETFTDQHWDGSRDKTANYVKFQSDALVHAEDRLSIERLLKENLGVSWNRLMASGVQVPTNSAQRLEQLWTAHLLRAGRSVSMDSIDRQVTTADEDFSPGDNEVSRELREVIQRRGQPSFREKLLAAYDRRCAVTDCDAVAALEAAHIQPYSGASSCKVNNGLLLRADIHTLFDLNLLGVQPSSLKIVLAPKLYGTCFEEFQGRILTLPRNVLWHPSKNVLRERWKQFEGNL